MSARFDAPHWLLAMGLATMAACGAGAGREPAAAALPPQVAVGSAAERQDVALDAEESATVALFDAASASVVCIRTLGRHQEPATLELHELPQGAGSGFVWDRQGHIVTNYHVVAEADAAEVSLGDHSQWRARLVGVAPEDDLVVLRIDAPVERLRPIPLGRSGELRVGQKVFAVGNPFGFDHSLTSGIVSALAREIESPTGETIQNVIQTDAAINPGNSGGPLLDSSGRLVGVNTAIFGTSGASAGLGFAIPVDTVARVVPQLIRHGRLQRPSLGIELAPDALARALGLRGALVGVVTAGSDAERLGVAGTKRGTGAGWLPGDLVESIDGDPIGSAGELLNRLEAKQAGEAVEPEL
ncbi:MAG TPA: trypsin-like peptidase domain-containing protein, partial [Thermoanaerobaculia bacterium]|nr:trypsin-like peptidase domain-containing protein [Thermoanaerobaculia bacterium]